MLNLLKECGIPINAENIDYAIFEYEPNPKERTNFDFYMILEDGTHISFEIKYTESEFGGITPDKKDPDKYKRKWKDIYADMMEKCPYLSCSEQEFYEKGRYQINRNICYAREGDVVLFLTPRANDAAGLVEGREYIDSFTRVNPKIRNIYWEDVIEKMMPFVEDEPELVEYFKRFKKKYIDIL